MSAKLIIDCGQWSLSKMLSLLGESGMELGYVIQETENLKVLDDEVASGKAEALKP